eukprot:TRINITY_DN31887_c0_g1_i1.p2 TRINITY_DN31887_c0_g1~~TRINITY_DN31887_c0_g1_i1.p2  ORF type:complete len:300 (+),score=59.71 TRINITY_DN31887_c0_g1_i1:66-902(+)
MGEQRETPVAAERLHRPLRPLGRSDTGTRILPSAPQAPEAAPSADADAVAADTPLARPLDPAPPQLHPPLAAPPEAAPAARQDSPRSVSSCGVDDPSVPDPDAWSAAPHTPPQAPAAGPPTGQLAELERPAGQRCAFLVALSGGGCSAEWSLRCCDDGRAASPQGGVLAAGGAPARVLLNCSAAPAAAGGEPILSLTMRPCGQRRAGLWASLGALLLAAAAGAAAAMWWNWQESLPPEFSPESRPPAAACGGWSDWVVGGAQLLRGDCLTAVCPATNV